MKIDLKNLDKSGWQTYRFDEIARNISQRVDPTSTDIEQYIGLEHLDKESLHIRRVGSKSEVKGQKLKCFPGDVIFGKRRAYQRKAAVVTEEAICSAHAFVLRANPEIINPSLFPFFLHSDQFMHRAVDISVGGLSPTINWGTLKSQEFLLPPKEQQGELAELLWGMDEVVESRMLLLTQYHMLFDSWINESINSKRGWETHPLSSVAKVQTGIAKNKKIADQNDVIKRPYLRVANVQDGFLDLSEIKSIHIKKKDEERYSLQKGDLLLTEGGDFDKVGRGFIWQDEIPNCLHQNHIFAVRVQSDIISPWFLSLMTRSNYGKQYFLRCAKKTSNLASINSSQLKELRVFLPSLEIQYEIVEKMHRFYHLHASLTHDLGSNKSLQKSLINQVF